jgi:hypothetical protein
MLSGQVRIEGDRLKLLNFNEEITLPAELTNLKAPNLQHPYFLVGIYYHWQSLVMR